MTEVVRSARPNGWGLRIVAGEGFFLVEEEVGGRWEESSEHELLAEAEAEFERLAAVLAGTPNWEAQARYDEEHGTDNGYDPRIEAWRRER